MDQAPDKPNLKLWLYIITGILILAFIIGILCYYRSANQKAINISKNSNNSPATSIPDVNINGVLFYEFNDQIWQYDFKTQDKKKIADGIQPHLSNGKEKLSYCNQNSGIFVYDVKTGQSKKIYGENTPFWDATWSPDDKYLLVDIGTSPTRKKEVMDSETGKKVTDFGVLGDEYDWISNNQIAFTQTQTIEPERPWGAGEAHNLSLINLEGNVQILKKATPTEDYNFIKISDGKIYFEKENVENQDEWRSTSLTKTSYWSISLDGKNEKEVDEIKTGDQILSQTVKSFLPDKYKNENYKATYPIEIPDSEFIIFDLYSHGQKPTNQIAIIEKNKPDTFRIMFEGTYPNFKSL